MMVLYSFSVLPETVSFKCRCFLLSRISGSIILHRYLCNIILPEIKNKMPKQVNVSDEEQLLFMEEGGNSKETLNHKRRYYGYFVKWIMS